MAENQETEDTLFMTTTLAYEPVEFVELVTNFPCFSDARMDENPEKVYEIILNSYRDDNLTEEQDLVVELIFHLSDESTPFNLKRACEVWSSEDLEAFWYVIAPEEETEHDA